jgi:LysM repeat protein
MLVMPGTQYTVQRGDTLWDLAEKHLGDPRRWPEIYSFNNTAEVVAQTGTRIVDPDLIFVGQVIHIPDGSGPTQPQPGPGSGSAQPRPESGGREPARPNVYLPAIKLNFPSQPQIIPLPPHAHAEVKLTGSITIQSLRPVDFLTFSNNAIEVKAKNEASMALSKLIADAKLKFDPSKGEVTFSNGITVHADTDYAPRAKVSISISSRTGLPVAKASFTAPPLRGRLTHYLYLTEDLGIEIEIHSHPQGPSVRPQPIQIPAPQPSHQPRPQPHYVPPPQPSFQPRPQPDPQPDPGFGWKQLVGSALIGAAVVLVVATIVEDIATLGAGVADDPASAAAAAAMVARGWTMIRGARMVPVVVRGAAPVLAGAP